MDRKIVFFDIDGTIYLYSKGIPDDTKKAIKKLKENGHIPVICSGRTISMIFDDVKNMGFQGIIAGGGTYVEYDGKLLFSYELPSNVVKDLIETMNYCNIMPIPEGIEHLYFYRDKIPEDYKVIYDIYCREIGPRIADLNTCESVYASKISGKILENGNLEFMKKKYSDEFTFVIHMKDYLEMIPKQFSKAEGIKRLIKYLDIPWENTYAFGDSMNDYEMLKYVNYGVAMGNAADEFKNKMNYVTEDYDKGGIYNALERFGLI